MIEDKTRNNISFGYTYQLHDGQSIRTRTVKACDAIDRIAQEIDRIEAQIKDLEAQGMTDAVIYWARKDDPDGKPDQLELTHSTSSLYFQQNNTRREYIGVKPDKIQEALDRINRFEKHKVLQRELNSLTAKLSGFERALRSMEHVAFAEQGHLFY